MSSSRVKYLEGQVDQQRRVIEVLQERLKEKTPKVRPSEEDAWIVNVVITAIKDGGWECKCKKGLWGVIAPTCDQATLEGVHYFRQYYADGEYDG